MLARVQFYAVVMIPGAVLMALEIVSSRVLAPAFGSSVYVWGSIIGVFLAAMSIGYVWGGRLADRRPRLADLGRLLLFAAVAQVVVKLVGAPAVAAIGAWSHGRPLGTLVAVAVLFAPPTVLLATVSPYAVKLATRELDQLGGTAGHLYALSTVGSLAGTLGATFALIPYLDLAAIQNLLVMTTVAAAVAGLASAWRSERASLVLAGALVLLAVTSSGLRVDVGYDVLLDRITPYQTLQVIESGGERQLRSDGVLHSTLVVASGEPAANAYPRQAIAALLVQPEVRSMLVLGMGSGAVASYLCSRLPALEVDLVDIDPAVPEAARTHMLFRDGPRLRVHVDDGRRFVNTSAAQWDFIYADTYVGSAVPFHLTTQEFMLAVKDRLRPGGVFGINLAAGPGHPFVQAIVRTARHSFTQTLLIRVRGLSNLLLLASDQRPRLTPAELAARATELDARFAFTPSFATVAGSVLAVDLDLTAVPILSDRFAPVNHLIHLDDRGGAWQAAAGAEPAPAEVPP